MSETLTSGAADKVYSGVHSRDHLTGILSDHYKGEDIDFHLWDEAEA